MTYVGSWVLRRKLEKSSRDRKISLQFFHGLVASRLNKQGKRSSYQKDVEMIEKKYPGQQSFKSQKKAHALPSPTVRNRRKRVAFETQLIQ
jgi:hypothetical protein